MIDSTDTLRQLPRWRLRSPMVQNMIASICLAMTPGIYSGITQLGAGAGKSASIVVNSQVNVIVYAIFFFVAICAGPALNVLGPKICIAFGTTGYAVYVGGLWYLEIHNRPEFPLCTGAYLGVTAGFLWTACAYTSHAYADESAKAWFIQFQLISQSTGSAIACAIALGVNYHKTTSGGVSSHVYGVFIAIHLLAGILAILFIVDPKTVQRDDGTYLSVFPRPTPRAEWEGMKAALTQPRVMFFIIAGFSFDLWVPPLGSFNAHTFALRARGLNGLCFFGFSMIGGLIFLWLGSEGGAGRWLKSKKDRAYAMLGYVLAVNAMGFGAWIGYLMWAGMGDRSMPGPGLDWTMGNEWARGFVVYILMGLSSTTLRSFAAWSLSNATNDPSKHARYAGLMHALPQAGSCMAFAIESETPRFIYQVIAYFALSVLSIGLCFVGMRWFLVERLYGVEEEGGIAPRGKEVGSVDGDGVGKECGIGEKKVGRVVLPTLEYGSFGEVIDGTCTTATTSSATLENPNLGLESSAQSAASSRTRFDTFRSTKSTKQTETDMSQEKIEGAE